MKIRWNTLKTGLSRWQQGFKSPWGRHQTPLEILIGVGPNYHIDLSG